MLHGIFVIPPWTSPHFLIPLLISFKAKRKNRILVKKCKLKKFIFAIQTKNEKILSFVVFF
jgi:hypothetical protein